MRDPPATKRVASSNEGATGAEQETAGAEQHATGAPGQPDGPEVDESPDGRPGAAVLPQPGRLPQDEDGRLRIDPNGAIYCNIRGLWLKSNRNKVCYLRDCAVISNSPFIVLTETHLKPEILDSEVKIEGYSLYRADRGPEKTHGGCAIYLRNDLIGRLVESHSNSMCETLIVKVKSLNLILICLYRPPNCTIAKFREALEVCQRAIDEVSEKDPKVKDILQFGDFNLPCITWPSRKVYVKHVENKSQEKQQAELLVKYVDENFLENYIYTATRGRNILDLVFTNNHLLVNEYTTVVNKKLTDHYLLNVKLNFSYNNINKVQKATNPYSTNVFEFNLSEADQEKWQKFEAVLDTLTVDFEEETKEDQAEVKLDKFYKHIERATAIIFERKKEFIEQEDHDANCIKVDQKKSKNKIPKYIRNLMKTKAKLSRKILSSTSWEKNYKTMTELEKVEEKLDTDQEKWQKFEAVLDTLTVDFEEETKEDKAEVKLEKF